MVARARVCTPGQTGTDPDGVEIPIEDGDVKLDSTADVQGTLDLTTLWEWPQGADGLLAPFGNEIYAERGLSYGDGTIEWVGLGYYRIQTPEQDQAPNGPIVITAQDRMAGIVEAKPLAPKQFLDGTSVSSVFADLVGEVYPTVTIDFDFDATTSLFTSSHSLEDDRYGFLKDIADSLGKVMYWDYRGHLVVRDAPDATVPVWDVTHGPDGVVVKVSRTLTREGAFNAVVATGEQTGESPPVMGKALDLNPLSPTYFYGKFGKIPQFYSSSFLTTVDQCQLAAAAKLRRVQGVPYSIDFEAVPNPALEVLDPIRVSYSDRDAVEIHVAETLTIPLVEGKTMTGTTRQQVVGGITG